MWHSSFLVESKIEIVLCLKDIILMQIGCRFEMSLMQKSGTITSQDTKIGGEGQ